MKHLTKILSFLLLILMSLPIPCLAAENKDYTEKVVIDISEYENFKPEKTIKHNGKKYVLVDYKIAEKEYETFDIVTTDLKDKKFVPENNISNPDKPNQTGTYVSTSYSEFIDDSRIITIDKNVTYTAVPLDYKIPNKYKCSYVDKKTNTTLQLELNLQNISQNKPYWIKGKDITGTVAGYEALSYQLKNSSISIPKNEKKPVYKGYEGEILKSLGLNPETYRITGATWNGSSYYSNNELCRNLTYSIDTLVCDASCIYADKVKLPDLTTYTATSTYIDKSSGKYVINVTYRQKNLSAPILISATLGLLIFALLIASIIFVISKSKEKETIDEQVKKRIQNINS